MEINFTLLGETPSKKNVNKFNTKTRRVYKDNNFVKWHDSQLMFLSLLAHSGKIKPFLDDKPLRIEMYFVHGDKKRRDSDNQCSSIMDLLVDSGIIKDDNWKIVREKLIVDSYQKNISECRIKIIEL